MHSSSEVIFKTLADPTRRAIFERLVNSGEPTARVLTDHAGVSQPVTAGRSFFQVSSGSRRG